MKKLSIIVTHYREPWETCHWLFDSLAMQQGIDMNKIEVLVVNDGRDAPLENNMFTKYPFKVTCYTKKNGGVSRARNFGLDHAKGDYVMFCDCDDMFINAMGLHLIFSAIQEGFDTLVSAFVEDQFRDGKYVLINHDTKDATYVHGKVHRRQYLVDRNIRFKDELTIHEDGYFNCIAQVLAETKKTISTPFYLWRWNDNSVVRSFKNQYFTLRTYDHLMKAREAICDRLKAENKMDMYVEAVVKTVVDSYYDFNKPYSLKPENKELRDKAESAFKQVYLKYRDVYNSASIDVVANVMAVCRLHAVNRGLRVEQRTISDWLKHIMTEVK